MKNLLNDETIERLKEAADSQENVPEGESGNKSEKGGDSFRKKIEGAIAAINKRLALDQTVEDNLSAGLNIPNFKAASKEIDKKRNEFVIGIESNLKIEGDVVNTETAPDFTLDDEHREALEAEMTDPFNKFVYDKLGKMNKVLLLDHLVDNPLNKEKSEIIENDFITEGNYNVVTFSDNGYLMQLTNKEEIKNGDSFDIKNEQAQYNIITPCGTILFDKRKYGDAFNDLKNLSDIHQRVLRNIFLQQESENKTSKENITEDEINYEGINATEEKIEKLIQQMEQTDAEITESEIEEKLPFNKFIKELDKDESINSAEVPVVDSVTEEVGADTETEKELAINNLESDNLSGSVLENIDSVNKYEPSPLFNKYATSKLGGLSNFEVGEFLENQDIDRNEVSVWDRKNISGSCIVSFSSVGYMTQLVNIDEVRDKNGVHTDDINARYNLIASDGEIIKQDLNYDESQTLLWSESRDYLEKLNREFEANKEENEKEATLNSNVVNYAESIGIKSKELLANQEFLSLSPEQQQFALETLRRTSLAKAKVAGSESFLKEKTSKPWWKLGFALNQNYHKERHKIEAVKNIESQGLKGYGETELNWLTEVIKTGPEIRANEAGEIIVNCLQENHFREDQKELVFEYNEISRKYIESTDSKVSKYLQKELDVISSKLLGSDERSVEMNDLLLKSKNNISLLKFLSADKGTEKLLNKMAETSFTGMGKTKAMIGAQKDKAGYAALGFTLRTGTKFALANSACLASAISYSVAPMAAAIVGGFRGFNLGKKELIEREELAKLGVKDQSSTARAMNLATGVKDGVNFGLTEKLQNLIDKLKKENRNDEIENITKELRLRIEYTEVKINSESVDYGSVAERNNNYLNLINTLAEAKSVLGELVVHEKISAYWVSDNVKELTRGKTIDFEKLGLNKKEDESSEDYQKRVSQNKEFVKYQAWANNEKRIEELGKISAHQRLASFLSYKEEKQHKKELNFLIKKTVTGAMMGATFAAIGAFVAEQLGITDWLSEHNPLKAAGKGIEAPKNVFSKDGAVSGAPTRTGVSEAVAALKTSNSVVEQAITAETTTPKVEKFVDTISNEGLNGKTDSVWRSVKEIFKANSKDLGYKGDPSNQQALDTWAETQTAKAVSHSGNLTDKVFSGNKVELINDGNHFKIAVEQGSGSKPAFLAEEIKQSEVLENDIKPLPNEQSVSDLAQKINQDFYAIDDSKLQRPVSPDQDIFIEKTAKELNLKNLSQQKNNLIYQGTGKSRIVLDSASHRIREIVDAGGNKIPDSFFSEMMGKGKPDKFIKHGGLDKILITWGKLSSDDKMVYNSLDWFNKKSLSPEDLLKQIRGVYEVKTDGVKIDNKHFVFSDGRKFDVTLKGVKDLVKFLARK